MDHYGKKKSHFKNLYRTPCTMYMLKNQAQSNEWLILHYKKKLKKKKKKHNLLNKIWIPKQSVIIICYECHIISSIWVVQIVNPKNYAQMHLINQYKIQLIIHITVYMHVYHRTPNKCNTLHITTQFITMVTISIYQANHFMHVVYKIYIYKRVLHVRRHKHTINRCHHMLVKLPVHRRR